MKQPFLLQVLKFYTWTFKSQLPGENVQQSEFIEIPVERRDGTRGVVEVRWVATIDGKVCPVFPHKRKIAKLYLMEIWLHRAK